MVNVGNSCYVNAILQAIFSLEITIEFCDLGVDDSGDGKLVATFNQTQEGRAFRPVRFLDDHHQNQQDAHEFLQRKILYEALTWAALCSGADVPRLLCSHCGKRGRFAAREEFCSLSMPLSAPDGSVYTTALAALTAYMGARQVVELDDWTCAAEACASRGAGAGYPMKTTNIEKWPNILILHLLRWTATGELVQHAVAPDLYLTIRRTEYALRAVVTHEGVTPQSGHYIAFAARAGRWHVCSDENIRLATQSEMISFVRSGNVGHTYLLFYEKFAE